MTTTVQDRVRGCLMGQLAGDSLGSLVEFRTARDIARQYPAGVRELADGGTFNTLAGQPTDDSEMALTLARSIVAAGRYSADDARAGYVEWYRSGPFDLGGTTAAALSRPTGGKLPEASHASQANGSLMRVSPLGIVAAGSPDLAVRWALQDSALTHPNEVCRWACVAYVAAIGTAIRTGNARQAFAAASEAASDTDERARPVLEALARARTELPEDFEHQQGWVLTAFQNAFYQLIHAPSLEEGVVATVGMGGDTDTNGCIAGALLGAVHGVDAIPYQWVHAVLNCKPEAGPGVRHPRPRRYWPTDAIQLADQLLLVGQRLDRGAR